MSAELVSIMASVFVSVAFAGLVLEALVELRR